MSFCRTTPDNLTPHPRHFVVPTPVILTPITIIRTIKEPPMKFSNTQVAKGQCALYNGTPKKRNNNEC